MADTDNAGTVVFTGFANPRGDLSNLSKEQHGIQQALNTLEAQGTLKKYLLKTDLSLEAYFDFLQDWENQLTVFHFGGHANGQEIGLHNNEAFFESLAQELVERNKNCLKFIFLNGCSTQGHVQTLFDLGAKAVIATSAEINDNLAALFAIRFYQNMAKGDTLEAAFKSARNYANTRQGKNKMHRILEEPENYRGSAIFAKNKQQKTQRLPWGLFVNDAQVLEYTLTQKQGKTNTEAKDDESSTFNNFGTVTNQIKEVKVDGDFTINNN